MNKNQVHNCTCTTAYFSIEWNDGESAHQCEECHNIEGMIYHGLLCAIPQTIPPSMICLDEEGAYLVDDDLPF